MCQLMDLVLVVTLAALNARVISLYPELCILDATATGQGRQWAPGAPQTLPKMMALADVTSTRSTCSTVPEGEADVSGLNHQQAERGAPDTAVFSPVASAHSALIVLTFQYSPYKNKRKKVKLLSCV